MKFTISTQNGTELCREHNVRDERYVKSQEHIDPNGSYEIWYDQPVEEAYEKIFGSAVIEYNKNQNRKDRLITNYLEKIEKDEKKRVAYEMVICVGNRKNKLDPDLGHEILYNFIKKWSFRNPNLHLIGAYYHGDEEGVPHVHVDYIPVAHNFKYGPHIQNSLNRALKEQGIPHQSHSTAQIQWERRENKALEELCKDHGIDIVHPQAGKGVKHYSVECYKIIQDARAMAEDIIASATEEAENIKNKAFENVQENIANFEDKLLELNKKYDSTVAKKTVGEFFMDLTKALKNIVNWQPTLIKEKKGLVTLKAEDYERLLHGYQTQKMIFKLEESILPEIREKAAEMEKTARIKAESYYNAHEVSVDRRVKSAEVELMRCRTKIDDLEKRSDRLSDLYHETRDELNSIMPVLSKFPEMWKKMRKKARRAITMEEIYYDNPLAQQFDFEGETYTRQQFVDEYIFETLRNNMEADNIIIDNLTADSSIRESLESEEDLSREHSL